MFVVDTIAIFANKYYPMLYSLQRILTALTYIFVSGEPCIELAAGILCEEVCSAVQ